MSFFLTLGSLVTIMVTFFTKKAQSLSKDNTKINPHEKKIGDTIPLFSNFTDTNEKNSTEINEVESSIPLFSTLVSATTIKKDRVGLGFLDEVGGSVDGLMSCTESLGFESSDERRADNDLNNNENKWEFYPRRVSKRNVVKSEVKKFPPPLSSLNDDGKPNFVLKPMRKDGRLELMEVKVERLEILRASRKDGRLRLDLIRDLDESEEEEYPMEKENDGFVEEKNDGRDERWFFPMMTRGGEGFRRCHTAVTPHDHHYHDIHGWRQACVVIR